LIYSLVHTYPPDTAISSDPDIEPFAVSLLPVDLNLILLGNATILVVIFTVTRFNDSVEWISKEVIRAAGLTTGIYLFLFVG
jgi:hypothetical protein